VGEDLVAGAPRASFWPIGELLDPEADSGIAAWFRARGRLLVAGNRAASRPSSFLAPVLATRRLEPGGTRLSFTEGVEIPGYLEHRGARFSGAALVRFVYLDVAAIEDDVGRLVRFANTIGPATARIAADPVLPAADGGERRSLDEPAEVAVKLELKALAAFHARHPDGSRAALLAEAIDAVLSHEIGHLEDAQRFLPIGDHLIGIAWKLATLGLLGGARRGVAGDARGVPRARDGRESVASPRELCEPARRRRAGAHPACRRLPRPARAPGRGPRRRPRGVPVARARPRPGPAARPPERGRASRGRAPRARRPRHRPHDRGRPGRYTAPRRSTMTLMVRTRISRSSQIDRFLM
jgi:hypothetical protein